MEHLSMFAHLYHLDPRTIDTLELREFDVLEADISHVLNTVRGGDGG